MHFGADTWPDDLVESLCEALRTATGLTRERVIPYFGKPTDLLKKPPGDLFLVCGSAARLTFRPEYTVSGGKSISVWSATLPVYGFVRIGAGGEFSHTQLLTASKGVARLARKIAVTLQEWDGGKTKEGFRLIEPAKLAGIEWGDQPTPEGWLNSTVRVNVLARTDLS